MNWRLLFVIFVSLTLASCSTAPTKNAPIQTRSTTNAEKGRKVTAQAKRLIGTKYRFGGKNPRTGLDCSGLVSYVYKRSIGLTVSGNAAAIARQGRVISRRNLRPGDLVFFNTRNSPYSHVGIYIGGDRFVHSPSSGGRVRIESMSNRYFAQRFHGARSYF